MFVDIVKMWTWKGYIYCCYIDIDTDALLYTWSIDRFAHRVMCIFRKIVIADYAKTSNAATRFLITIL